MKCVNIPRLATAIASNVVHSYLPSSPYFVVSILIVPALTNSTVGLKKLDIKARNGLTRGERRCIISGILSSRPKYSSCMEAQRMRQSPEWDGENIDNKQVDGCDKKKISPHILFSCTRFKSATQPCARSKIERA
jgi:hypothetical protein